MDKDNRGNTMKSYLRRLLESNSFLLGIFMAFDVSGVIGAKCSNDDASKACLRVNAILNSVKTVKQESAEESLRSIFEAVGNDMRLAMSEVHK